MVFAFYELSGGKDFVPRSETRRLAAADASKDADTPTISVASLSTRSSTPKFSPSRTQAMAVVDTRNPVTQPKADKADKADRAVLTAATGSLYPLPDDAVRAPGITLVSLGDNPALFAQPLVETRTPEANNDMTVRPSQASAIASPVSGAANPATAKRADFIPDQRDIRAVDGNRVNMRNGPGTNFSVLASLPRDTRVEVLTDPGDGWVRLQPINGGPIGWMADYLLTSVNN